jgi:glucose-6-phosphate dehydrogenase assembly protein OpcA
VATDLSDGKGNARSDPSRPAPGTILAVGQRSTGGRIEPIGPVHPGEPQLRWMSKANTIDEIEKELSRIWAQPGMILDPGHERSMRQAAARTSVMNLVVVAGDTETGARTSETISRLTGRHPSRTLIVLIADPDGPPWLDGRIQAQCMVPRQDAPESCSEMVYLTAGGETGRHLGALVTPLLVHDLPVTTWWPGEPPLGTEVADEIMESTDRLVVDGSMWRGDGLSRLRQMAALYDMQPRISIRDFGFVRQSRWREAIATVFDLPDFLPFLGYVRRLSVTYGTRDETGAPGTTNVVKPLYHVAWFASRLGMKVVSPLTPVASKGPAPRLRPGEKAPLHRGLAARLRDARSGEVGVVIRPVTSSAPAGTTLRLEILAERRGSELRADVTAEADNVQVRAWVDGVEAMDRTFKAPRRNDIDLLAEALEGSRRDIVTMDAIRMAAKLAGSGGAHSAHPD